MIQISKKKLEELKQEYQYLINEGREEIAKKLSEAKAFGDLKENAEYHQAREDQARLESRIKELEAILKEAVVLDSQNTGVVSLGSIVTVQNLENKNKQTYEIVSDIEADILENKISENSPIAKSMIGKKEGEEFEFEKPNGEIVKYKIIEIK